jgi:hypothetical protein
MNTVDDETGFEERIRVGLASRDPGSAPARLRDRVGAVTSEVRPRGSRIHRFITVARPAVAATLTLAAVLLGVLIVAVVRPGTRGEGFPEPSAGPGGPTSGPDLATVRDPLALSLGWTVFIALLVLLVAWAAVEVYLRTPGAASIRLRRLDRKRARGLVVLALATPILIFGQVVRDDSSLAPGGFFQASLVHLEGMGTTPGTMPGLATGHEAAWYRLISRGTITFVQAVRNAGSWPITLTGTTGADAGFELRLLGVHDPSGPIDVDKMPTYPFAAFELAPGEEREIVVVIHLADCPGNPAPSIEPSPDLSGDYVPQSPYATENFASLGLTYSVLGVAREADVRLFATVVARSPDASVCGTDENWANRSPSPPAP